MSSNAEVDVESNPGGDIKGGGRALGLGTRADDPADSIADADADADASRSSASSDPSLIVDSTPSRLQLRAGSSSSDCPLVASASAARRDAKSDRPAVATGARGDGGDVGRATAAAPDTAPTGVAPGVPADAPVGIPVKVGERGRLGEAPRAASPSAWSRGWSRAWPWTWVWC